MAESPTPLDATLDRMDFGRALKAELLMDRPREAYVPYAQPLLDAVALFETLGLGYAIIGGIAAMNYGRARFTEDVDFVAQENHMSVLSAHAAEMEIDHFDPNCTFELYHPSGVQVDICKDDHAADIIRRARGVQVAGRTVQIIDATDLAAMKLRARRLKDDYDISEMLAAQTVNEDELRTRVDARAWAHFLDIKRRVADQSRRDDQG